MAELIERPLVYPTRAELIEFAARKMTAANADPQTDAECVAQLLRDMFRFIDALGLVLVPGEPDSNMVLAAGGAMGELSKTVRLSTLRPYEYLKPQWDAMLRASPYAKERDEAGR